MSREKLHHSDILKTLREELGGVSQAKLANEVNVPVDKIKAIEAGKTKISAEFALLLEEKLHVNLRWLLTGKGDIFPQNILQQPDSSSSNAAVEFKISEALTMTAGVLESGTSYATALYLNIQHFHRAIQAETRLARLESRVEALEEVIRKLTSKGTEEESLEKEAI